jgi:ribosomal-protein-alanine N-acetyltransferase
MIRKMELFDVDQVYEIENQSFFEPWSKEKLVKELLGNKLLEHYVFDIGGEIAGFYIVNFVLDEADIFTIAVKNDYRRKGIGSKLLDHLEEIARKKAIKYIRLEVSTKNYKAIKLYEKHGFKQKGLRVNYYQKTNEDAYVMRKDLE